MIPPFYTLKKTCQQQTFLDLSHIFFKELPTNSPAKNFSRPEIRHLNLIVSVMPPTKKTHRHYLVGSTETPLTLIGLAFFDMFRFGGWGDAASTNRPHYYLRCLWTYWQRNFVQGFTIKALAEIWEKIYIKLMTS